MALLTFAVTLFASAFLLFLVQPIIGQKILPKLGGTPSVWNTCVVFFQCTLLIGYAYTHFTTKLPVKRQILIHCALLLVPFLILLPSPFSVDNFKPVTGGDPTLYTLGLLAMIVGIPFFVVSTTAPLLQKWFGATGHPAAKDPYFLYGASNLGSMLSLLLYPPLFEPLFGLEAQSWFYTIGYVGLVAMVAGCGAMAFMAPPPVQIGGKSKDEEPEHVPSMAPEPPPESDATPGLAPSAPQITAPPSTAVSSGPPPAAPRPTTATGIKKGGKKGKGRDRDLAKAAPATAIAPAATASAIAAATATPSISIKSSSAADTDDITWPRRLRWIGLAAVPSSLMLGVTTYMSTDISAIPLFWVLPLALYLLSFILVFMRWPINWLEQAHEFVLYAQPIALAVLALMLVIGNASIIVWMIVSMVVAFTLTALACHGEMAKDRPSAKHLTEFYLMMSVGGAIGGLFNGILAPVIFAKFGIVEFGLALAAAGLLRPTMRDMGWTEMLMSNMGGDSGETGKHHHGKGGKKITKATADTAGMTLILDFMLPVAVLALLGLTLAIFSPGRGEGGTETLFYAFIIPIICTACMFARPLRFGLALAGVLLCTGLYLESGSLFQTRSYFGVLRVRQSVEHYGDVLIPYKNLTHGTTHHGMSLESTQAGKETIDLTRVATTYYHRQGPVGICMDRFNWFPFEYASEKVPLAASADRPGLVALSDYRMPASLWGLAWPTPGINLPMAMLTGVWSEPSYAVIGMGTATMSTYCRPFQTCHFYEIDEQIRLLSLPPSGNPYFGYVKAAHKRGGNVQILMGDARLRMAMPWVPEDPALKDKPSWEISEKNFNSRGGPEYFYSLMVVDAFSSDAIPRHLITKEAIEMYFRHLKQGHWGNWIQIDPKDQTRDIHGEKIDLSKPDFSEDKPEGDKLFRRWWYPGGLLCVHTSNRHLRLVPVVADTCGIATWENQYDADKSGKPNSKQGDKVTGLFARRAHDNAPGHSAKDPRKNQKDDIGHFTSEWVIVARDEKDIKSFKEPTKYKEWCEVAFGDKDPRRTDTYWSTQSPTGTYIWTDDHSNLMAVFRWPWSRHAD